MFSNLLYYSLDLLSKIKTPIFYSLICSLLFSIITPIRIFRPLSNKDNPIVKFQEVIQADYIKENADLFLISTKDGYLHAINREKNQIWKVYLEQELMSSQINGREIGKNFSLYPIKEQLYILQNGELISFNIFIKDLVKNHFITIDDFTLLGKTKTTLFIIDIDTGEIIRKIDDENNITFKKQYILSKNRNTISVVRVDYILNCLGKDKEKILWNVTYSDILIKKRNENLPDNTKIISPNIKEIINEYNINNNDYKNDIILDSVINAYSYFNHDLPPIKIYDRSESKIEGGLKYIKNYNNENKLGYIDNNDDNHNIKKLDNLSKNKGLLELPGKNKNNNIFDNSKNINENSKKDWIINKLKYNWYLYLIILILSCMVFYYKLFDSKTMKEKEKKEEHCCMKKDNENKDMNTHNNTTKNEEEKLDENNGKNNNKNDNKIINEEKKFQEITENISDIDLISFKNKSTIFISKIRQKNISKKKDKTGSIEHDDLLNNEEAKLESEEKKNNNKISNKTIEINTQKNSNNALKINSNNNYQILDDKKENSNTKIISNGIWDEDDESNEEKEEEICQNSINELEKSEIKGKKIICRDDNEYNDNDKKEKTIDINSETNNIEKTEIKSNNEILEDNDEGEVDNNHNYNDKKEKTIDKNSKKTNNIEKSELKSNNGIWDNDDDDEYEENEEDKKEGEVNTENKKKTKKLNDSSNISKNSDNSYQQKETKENTEQKKSKDINFENKKEKKLSRLDMDFENLVKIGEGGFGIVLKGTHKIDKDIYAIKIIDLTFKKKEHDEIISEAQKMKSIKGEYIVNYSICWYDDNLGSAEKFFENQDNSLSSESKIRLSKSISFNILKNEKKTTLCFKKDEEIYDIKEVNDEDNYDENNICKKISKSKSKNKNINNSLELNENNNTNQIYNNRSRYCFDYMDDSRLLNNSILSRKYNEELYSNKDKKYFFILMEYCDGLTLENYIKEHSNKNIERKIIYTYIKQILKGLKKLHKNGIIHRDIKPGNIFIKNEQIKIGDFGLATKFQKNTILQTKDLRGFTPTYAAPEQTKSKTYNEKVDIYATGITLYEMCSCFGTEMERQLALRDLKNKGIISERISSDYPQETKLIIMMTKEDYNDRPSAEQILKSDLFNELGKIVNK